MVDGDGTPTPSVSETSIKVPRVVEVECAKPLDSIGCPPSRESDERTRATANGDNGGLQKLDRDWAKNLSPNDVLELRAGNCDVWNRLISGCTGSVLALIWKRVREREAAKDISQDAWVHATRAVDSFGHKGNNFYAWILRIADNAAIHYLRKKSQNVRMLADHAAGAARGPISEQHQMAIKKRVGNRTGPIEERIARAAHPSPTNRPSMGAEEEIRAVVEAEMCTLTDEDQQLVRSLVLEGHSHREAAKTLNIPLGTLKTRWNKIQGAFRERVRLRLGLAGGWPHGDH
jgi:RNA polymerase sigma factor (sigma-70 family)